MNETPQTSFKSSQENVTTPIPGPNSRSHLGSKCSSKKVSARTSTRSSRVASPSLKRVGTVNLALNPQVSIGETGCDDDDEDLFADIGSYPLQYEDLDSDEEDGVYTEEQITAYYEAVNKLWTPK